MKSPLLRTSLLIILLISLHPRQALGQEIIRLFDSEEEEHSALADPGRFLSTVFWRVGGTSTGLFDQAAPFSGLTHPQLLAVEGDELFLVDGIDGTRALVSSLPDLDPELNEGIVFPNHLPAIWSCYEDDGTIYVLTYGRQGWDFKMLWFDTSGNAIGNALLPVRLSPSNTPYPATVHQGIWCQVAENRETGEWELIVLEFPF